MQAFVRKYIDVPKDVADRLKIVCAERNVSQRAFIAKAISDACSNAADDSAREALQKKRNRVSVQNSRKRK